MKSILETLKQNAALVVMAAAVLAMAVSECSLRRAVRAQADASARVEARIVALTRADSLLAARQRPVIQEELYRFLIFEDDLDKGKTSLSGIKMTLEDAQDTAR